MRMESQTQRQSRTMWHTNNGTSRKPSIALAVLHLLLSLLTWPCQLC